MKWKDFKEAQRQRLSKYKNICTVDIQCPVCNNDLYMRTDIVLCSYPPQRQYFCDKCNWQGTA